MTGHCQQNHCYPDSGCALGEVNKTRCEHWIAAGTSEQETSPPASTSPAGDVPWSGRPLGTQDLVQVAARGPVRVIGVIGPAEAGKTTFLMYLYLLLQKGHELASGCFAGSFTLGAWEALAGYARWSGDDIPSTFPPHTTSEQTRVPGLLHIALRTTDGKLRDVLFTDAPGEWFTAWADKEQDPQAEGARWVTSHADGFLVFADSARLSGPERGKARGQLRSLLERMRNHVGSRPVSFVWAKADMAVPVGIAESLRTALQENLPRAQEASVTKNQPNSIIQATSSLLAETWTAPRAEPLLTPLLEDTPFGSFRGYP